ncbi:MAG TPA: ParB N-terminal domain-containing protein [Dissulfurispiraceae bacterium]|nr:ParB N-terminal domain-containing protein [Dissulfurispiraceae bacterium]
MEIQIKAVKLSTINLNPDNPRRISNQDMDRLVKSLQEFPDMLNIREIVVDETMTVLGGNMRLLALRKIGAKEARAKIVKGLTPEQKREFVVKDNSAFGEWDWDALSGWDDLPLSDWGIKGIDDEESTKPKLDHEEKELRPYIMSHVLLSFPPEKLLEIQKHLEKIIKIKGVEYEQSSN